MALFRNTCIKRWVTLLACLFYATSPLASMHFASKSQSEESTSVNVVIREEQKAPCHNHSSNSGIEAFTHESNEAYTNERIANKEILESNEQPVDCVQDCCKVSCSGMHCHSQGAMALGDVLVAVALMHSDLPDFLPQLHSLIQSPLFRPPILA